MIPELDKYKKRWSIESDSTIKPGLEQIYKALTKTNHPEKNLKVIHVAGTNGKGSTIAFMESILRAHGYKVGVFSSPAIIDIHDQIRIDGCPTAEEELDKTFKKMQHAGLSGLLTDFELLTVAAFITFERLQPDYVLIETGMGGTLDSTNVVHPLVSVITSIALDHTSLLGNTLQEIASHKAGIIKEGIPVVVGELGDESLKVVEARAEKLNSSVIYYCEEPLYKSKKIQSVNMQMRGAHQLRNAAVAIAALRAASIPLVDETIKQGVYIMKLGNRFEEVYPHVYVDGAHNPAAAKALVDTIQAEFPNKKIDFVIGMLKNKDIKGTLDELVKVAQSFTFLSFEHPEAATGGQLMRLCNFDKKRIIKHSAIQNIFEKNNQSKTYIVTGSLYLLASLFKEYK